MSAILFLLALLYAWTWRTVSRSRWYARVLKSCAESWWFLFTAHEALDALLFTSTGRRRRRRDVQRDIIEDVARYAIAMDHVYRWKDLNRKGGGG